MTTNSPLDLNNVQGDILEGIAKKAEAFFFFQIKQESVSDFRAQLSSLIPLITSVTEAQGFHQSIRKSKQDAVKKGTNPPLLEIKGVNISFSQKGLNVLGFSGPQDDLGDSAFKGGMSNDISILGDKLEDWDDAFKKDIHGVILVAAHTQHCVDDTLKQVKKIFHVGHKDATVVEMKTLEGHPRPGKEHGHEHFGFNDGLSQPAVADVTTNIQKGLQPIDQGVFLLGRKNDNVARPSWALDGSFLAFRYLKQLVPEFDAFLEAHALEVPTPIAPGDPTGAELLGARFVGRWKSGAPLARTPLRDDPTQADPSVNQDFTFDKGSQVQCPFAAHTRKTNPRGDLASGDKVGVDPHRILRRGIPFGPEVTEREKHAKKSSDDEKLERGLLFVCYQSNLKAGFQFLQQFWANNSTFPPESDANPSVPVPGLDPIIGVGSSGIGSPRELVGSSPDVSAANQQLDLTADWVIPRGGEYFFSPSISALKTKFSGQAAQAAGHEL